MPFHSVVLVKQVPDTANITGKTMNDDGTVNRAALPAIFNPEDLNALVAQYSQVPEDYPQPTVKRYELTGRQILIYIGNLSNEYPLSFSYRLLAKFPIIAKTPASSIYDYYNPEVSDVQEPQMISVSAD